MKYINKIIKPIVTLISNIKYLLCNNIEDINLYQTKCIDNRASLHTILLDRVNNIYDSFNVENIDDMVHDMQSTLDDMKSNLDDKVNEYEVKDILSDEFGYSEDYISHDDMIDIREDVEGANEKMKSLKTTFDMCIEHLKNGGFSDELTESYRELATHKVIEELIFRLGNNENV
tara:strand:- start:549 stop:1070 length:522 start_codon:yes stop_codon:yes gene_type:complete